MTAGADDRPVVQLPVGRDGTVPGRPRSSLLDPAGPWAAGRSAAEELRATGVDAALADAPGRFLLVPSAWLAGREWAHLWARAHRAAGRARRAAGGRALGFEV